MVIFVSLNDGINFMSIARSLDIARSPTGQLRLGEQHILDVH